MNTSPQISYMRYRLEVEKDSNITPGKKFWSPVGCEEGTLERAKRYLKSDFNLYKEFPNIKYRIVEVTHWKDTSAVVEEGQRE